VIKLGVRDMPGSGTPEQLLSAAGIDAEHIVQAVMSLLPRKGNAVVSKREETDSVP
jgi:hypothetical protein